MLTWADELDKMVSYCKANDLDYMLLRSVKNAEHQPVLAAAVVRTIGEDISHDIHEFYSLESLKRAHRAVQVQSRVNEKYEQAKKAADRWLYLGKLALRRGDREQARKLLLKAKDEVSHMDEIVRGKGKSTK